MWSTSIDAGFYVRNCGYLHHVNFDVPRKKCAINMNNHPTTERILSFFLNWCLWRERIRNIVKVVFCLSSCQIFLLLSKVGRSFGLFAWICMAIPILSFFLLFVHMTGSQVDVVPVRRALVSVSDKAGIVEFCTFLSSKGVELWVYIKWLKCKVWHIGRNAHIMLSSQSIHWRDSQKVERSRFDRSGC